MGEAIISRADGGGNVDSQYEFITEIITENKMWVVPEAKNNQFSIRIFGGGGGGGGYGPGAVGGHGEQNLNTSSWAANCNGAGGGGGYNCPGVSCSYNIPGYSGGGGGYSPELASGGNKNNDGKPGVCIIQYYVAE